MLSGMWRGIRWRVSLLFPALLTALLLIRPDGLAVCCVLSSLIHEGGHLLAMTAAGCPPDACTVGAFGARIEMGRDRPVSYGRNEIISLAGPAANGVAALILWGCGCPRAALVNALLGGFNLLPASALDGGQILRCCLCRRGHPEKANGVLTVCSAAVLLPLAAGTAWLYLSGQGNGTLLLVTGYLTGLIFFHPE